MKNAILDKKVQDAILALPSRHKKHSLRQVAFASNYKCEMNWKRQVITRILYHASSISSLKSDNREKQLIWKITIFVRNYIKKKKN